MTPVDVGGIALLAILLGGIAALIAYFIYGVGRD